MLAGLALVVTGAIIAKHKCAWVHFDPFQGILSCIPSPLSNKALKLEDYVVGLTTRCSKKIGIKPPIINSVVSYLHVLELCGSIKKTLWESCQLVIVEMTVKKSQSTNSQHTQMDKWTNVT